MSHAAQTLALVGATLGAVIIAFIGTSYLRRYHSCEDESPVSRSPRRHRGGRFVVLAQAQVLVAKVERHGQHVGVGDAGRADGLAAFAGGFVASPRRPD